MKNLVILACLFLAFTNLKAEVIYCGGTEPFWGATINEEAKTVKYNMAGMEDGEVVYKNLKTSVPMNDLSVRNFKASKGLFKKKVSGFISITDGEIRSFCSDGMSDFNYQYEIFMDVEGVVLQGCCESTERPRLGSE